MASLTNTSSTNINNLYSTTNSSNTTVSSQNSASSSSSALANESTFLRLLVAQLQNQDPTQPADGMQFVTQLAQFSSLEQNLAMRNDLDSIKTKIVDTAPASSADSSKTGTGSSSSV